ncbi:MAG TPA: polysaccharide biosynthesis protein [Candidatus Brocadiia bacterium]|nr:polysaccharide biosynthesis protein [Planctomycetota bacterium]MDO8091960.1 nucleoside-diphosphate sugar epimerase/dehydratase [Candidatus Brocadiales bacterium]
MAFALTFMGERRSPLQLRSFSLKKEFAMRCLFKTRKDAIKLFIDILIFVLSYAGSFLLRFDGRIPPEYFNLIFLTLPVVIGMRFFTFWLFGMFYGVWRYTGIADLRSIFKAATFGTLLLIIVLYPFHFISGYPRSIFIMDWSLLVILAGGVRFLRRLMLEGNNGVSGGWKRALIVGAGDTGELIVHETQKGKIGAYKVVALIDDDPEKISMRIHGVNVVGNVEAIPQVVRKDGIDEVIVAIPSATGKEMQRIMKYCRVVKVPVKVTPALREIETGEGHISQLRDVQLEDLIGREPVYTDLGYIKGEIAGKVIMVTGAGGSIGTEICRQVASFHPRKLILFERAENNLFYLLRALQEEFPAQEFIPVIGDIINTGQVKSILNNLHPYLILHTAAHKHVPLMELNPFETIRNNVVGTKNLAWACSQNGVEKFILLSTDKAANPACFMGVSKRIAELYIQGLAKRCNVKFMSVRFGNVLESTGSVVRIFKEQIAKRSPLTVTHPDVMRYFMSKSEAVHLVLQAAAIGAGGEIFVLDMGKPVKILDVAKEIIHLAGLEPHKDIGITFTGLRMGEKIVETLFNDGETICPTSHSKIRVVVNGCLPDWDKLNDDIQELEEMIEYWDASYLKEKLFEIVPTYKPGFVSEEVLSLQ